MQSIFRLPTLPWPQAGAPFSAHGVDLPAAGNAIKGKRKRALDSSPRSSPSPIPKKMKGVMQSGGAVQVAPEQFVHGPDGTVISKPMNVIAPKPAHTALKNAGPQDTTHKSSGIANLTSVWRQDEMPSYAIFGNMQTAASVGNAAASFGRNTLLHELQVQQTVTTAPNQEPGKPPKAEVATVRSQQETQAVAGASPGSDVSLSSSSVMPNANLAQTTYHSQEQTTSMTKPQPKMKASTDHVRAIVEIEINQAILTKHNELRLIDQEIAKCQVALEQIRRCQLIPYPALEGFSVEVATHSGAALATPNGYTIPQHPAPWGVTDGPYTRHLSSWLVQSPVFDPRLPDACTPSVSPYPRDGRVTRGSGVDVTPLSAFPSARSARTATSRVRQGFDVQSPVPQRDPLIIKRNQDGQWVKLYCTECKPERSDFANVQGFLNHCRISHKLDYKSHEAAAIACGRVVSNNDAFTLPEPTPTRDITPRASVSTCVDNHRVGVHALIKGPIKGRENIPTLQQILPRSASSAHRIATGLSTPTTPTNSSTFKPSNDTPFLSKFLAQRGFSGDLAAAVLESKRKVDLSCYDDSESEPDMPSAKKIKVGKQKGVAVPRSSASTSTIGKPSARGGPKNLAPATTALVSGMKPVLPSLPPLDASRESDSSALPTPSGSVDVDMGLSPHGMESNPGLVSDRDEDDDEMDEDEITTGHDAGKVHVAEEMIVKIQDSDGEATQVDETQSFCAARAGAR